MYPRNDADDASQHEQGVKRAPRLAEYVAVTMHNATRCSGILRSTTSFGHKEHALEPVVRGAPLSRPSWRW